MMQQSWLYFEEVGDALAWKAFEEHQISAQAHMATKGV